MIKKIFFTFVFCFLILLSLFLINDGKWIKAAESVRDFWKKLPKAQVGRGFNEMGATVSGEAYCLPYPGENIYGGCGGSHSWIEWRDSLWQTFALPTSTTPMSNVISNDFIPPPDIGNFCTVGVPHTVFVPPAPSCSCGGPWFEFKPESSGQRATYILVRSCALKCIPSGLNSCAWCVKVCGSPVRSNQCGEWQTAYGDWSPVKPACRLVPDYIDPPQKVRYYNNPLYPSKPWSDPETGISSKDIKLPVKLDWDEAIGWYKGFNKGGKLLGCQEECVRSYKIQIKGVKKRSKPKDEKNGLRKPEALRKIDVLEEKIKKENDPQKIDDYEAEIKRIREEELEINFWEEVLDQSEFIPPAPCFFRSDWVYQWRVRGCGSPNGTNCGPWSEWFEFSTAQVPEPKLPYPYNPKKWWCEPDNDPAKCPPFSEVRYDWFGDPDWAGPEKREDLPLELTLKWCESNFKYEETEGPRAYKLLFYETREGKDSCHPLLKYEGKCLPYLLVPEPGDPSLYPIPEFSNEKFGKFTKDTDYAWEVAACKDSLGNECTDYSQRWRFKIKDKLKPPQLIYPPHEPTGEIPVNLNITFQWAGSLGSSSFVWELCGVYGCHQQILTTPTLGLTLIHPNKKFSWRVKPCWDLEGKNCQEEAWSEKYEFWTTGRPPKPETMKPRGADVLIPVKFEWEKVPGAECYNFKIKGGDLDLEEIVDERAEFILDYPQLKPNTNYSWQVQTCGRYYEGRCLLCGEDWASQSFTTFELKSPTNPKPANGETLASFQKSYQLSWEKVRGAKSYQYKVEYQRPAEGESEECQAKGGEIILEKITKDTSTENFSLFCLGDYQWQVRACLDENCQASGPWGGPWTFSLIESKGPKDGSERPKGGLVPCNLAFDNPKTPWNERKPCQIEHLFILVYNILNFVLWKLAPLMLVVLAIVTALLYYLSMGAAETIFKVKALWKAAGIGYGIIFLAWLIIDIFLVIFGYKVGVFGPWWKISF